MSWANAALSGYEPFFRVSLSDAVAMPAPFVTALIFCVPNVKYLGLTPQDILDFDLGKATHPLADQDMKRAFDALKNDPFFQSHKPWKDAIDLLMKMEKRAEQQALSLHGLNFVIDEYLPRKLKEIEKFLP